MRPHTTPRRRADILLAVAMMAAVDVFATDIDISDVPMAVKNNAPPNFMYVIDNSGSMHNIVPEAPYSEKVTYLDCGKVGTVMGGGVSDTETSSSSPVEHYIVIAESGEFWIVDDLKDDSKETSYRFGTSEGEYCFDPRQKYKIRLFTDVTNPGACEKYTSQSCKIAAGYTGGGIYSGNYLNWYFGSPPNYTTADVMDYENGRKKNTIKRMEVARDSTISILDNLPLKDDEKNEKAKARVGLVTLNEDGGKRLHREIADLDADHLAAMKEKINALKANGSTPLASTLADVGHYFTYPYTGDLTLHPDAEPPKKVTASVAKVFRQSNAIPHTLGSISTAPVQYWCQRSYVVLMTDGRPMNDRALFYNKYLCDYDGDSGNCTWFGTKAYDKKTGQAATGHAGHRGAVHSYERTGSDYLDDVAQALYEIDLRPDLPGPRNRPKKNNVVTYTVGFGDDEIANEPLLEEAARQGGGEAKIAKNTPQLVQAFQDIMKNAMAREAAAAGVAVVNPMLQEDDVSYASSYVSGSWTGDLQAFTIDASTGQPNDTPVWRAQEKLDNLPLKDRKIVTYNGRRGVPFQPKNVDLGSAHNEDLIHYLRGGRTNEESLDDEDDEPKEVQYRKRKSLLGDIINAEPVVVKYEDGVPIVYQAANDGMLHAFNGCVSSEGNCSKEDGGTELWAYVPRMVWNKLSDSNGGLADPKYEHQYIVDATPVVSMVNGRRLLVGGLGKGGKGYYALDITSYAADSEAGYAEKVKWEFPATSPAEQNSVGYSYGIPLIVNTSDGKIVLVTSGVDNDDGVGKVFALDPESGSVLYTIGTGTGNAGSQAGLVYLSAANRESPDDLVQYVWGGDLLGNVWRFDLDDRNAEKIAELRDSGGKRQPVSTAPAVGKLADSKYMVYVGTGLYLGDSDIPGNNPVNGFATQVQSLYGIIDDTAVPAPKPPEIRNGNGNDCPPDGGDGEFICQQQTPLDDGSQSYQGTTHALGPDHRGWYLDLPITGSRIVTHPQLTSGGAIVATINIPTNKTCDPGGISYFLNLDARNGGAVNIPDKDNKFYPTIIFISESLASRPTVVVAKEGNKEKKYGVIRLSDDKTVSLPIREPSDPPTPPVNQWRRIYWRELM
jgi:type IV pilus assembly protein PilY1